MHMVSVLLSEMVLPNVPKTSTQIAIIRPSPRGDRDTMHASRQHTSSPNSTPHTLKKRLRINGMIVNPLLCVIIMMMKQEN